MADNLPTEIVLDSGRLRIEVAPHPDGKLEVGVFGTVDEDANFSGLLKRISSAQPAANWLRFDLSGIQRINSCGVREWILFMERLGNAFELRYHSINELFAEQASIVSGMFGKGKIVVETFQAPYACQQCDRTVLKILTPKEVLKSDGDIVAPDFVCETCQSPLEFDWIADEYFGFLRVVQPK
jgi:hypothetical protein